MSDEDGASREQLVLENGKTGKTDEEITKKKKTSADIINKHIDEYVDGFTVHGLTKVFKAQRKEAVVWIIFITIGVLFAGIVIGRLVTKYYKYETYTEVKQILTDKNPFPSISVCEFKTLQSEYFSYCGSRMSMKDNDELSSYCDHSKIYNNLVKNISVDKDTNWHNGLFEVQHCLSWDAKDCNIEKYFKSNTDLNNACFTWNFNGDFTGTYAHMEMSFKYHNRSAEEQPRIIVIPHDPEIAEIDLTKMVTIDSHKTYEINIGKTILIRKPAPYSDCTLGTDLNELDILPGAYTRRTCLESYKWMEAYKKCGDTLDYIRKYMPDNIKQEYKKNKTVKEIQHCMTSAIAGDVPKGLCPFPCKELSLSISPNAHQGNIFNRKKYDSSEWIYNVEIQLQSVDSYTVMEELPFYSAEQMSAEIGGFLGLVMGASLLSFVEIFACGVLYTIKRVYSTE